MKQYCLAFITLFTSFHASSQNVFAPDSIRAVVHATKITSQLKVDGRLSETEWKLAQFVPDFIQMDPYQGRTAVKQTQVRLLYNDNYLYVGAICYDTVGRTAYRVPNLKRDFAIGSGDDFTIAIDGYNDDRNAAAFATNPYGVQSDLLSFDDNYYDVDWDGLWIVRTQRSDSAWVAEMAIPWKSLRYKSSEDSLQTWGISFQRMARAKNELSSWPAYPRAYTTFRMPYAAKLKDIRAPKPATNIRLQPYMLFSDRRSKTDRNTTAHTISLKPGGDAKWAINPNTLLDLTFNTDFAQSDVDRLVNNANRFSVFFPEKRQFFLENAGLFAAGIEPLPGNGFNDYSARIQPFFSRRIGLDRSGTPLTIAGGGRLINRTDKQNFGALVVKQLGNNSTNPAWFFTSRYSQNFGKQNRIGALVTYKTDEQSLDSVATDRGFTGALDGFIRFNQKLSLSYMGSVTTDRTKMSPGYAATAQLQYNSNKLAMWWNESANTDKYDPKMGFVGRSNVIITEPGFSYQMRSARFPKSIRAIFTGASYIVYHNTRTLAVTDRYLSIIPVWCRLQDRSLIFYNVIFTKQNVETEFKLLGENVARATYEYTRQKFGYASDLSKKISTSLVFNVGNFYNGRYNSVTHVLNIAPVPYVFISSTLETGKLKEFGEQAFTKDVRLYSVETRLAMNPRLQLSGLFQKSTVNNNTGWNFRFSWEFQPRSFVYVVFNNNSVMGTARTDDQQFITKISYLKQF